VRLARSMDAPSKRRTAGSPRNKQQIYGHCRCSACRPWVLRSRAARPAAGGSPVFARLDVQAIAGLCARVGLAQSGANPEFRSAWRWCIIGSNPASMPSPSINARCGLTLASSGRPPARPAKLLRLLFRFAGQSGARLSCQTLGASRAKCNCPVITAATSSAPLAAFRAVRRGRPVPHRQANAGKSSSRARRASGCTVPAAPSKSKVVQAEVSAGCPSCGGQRKD
jgi:hypothetical protein